MLTKTYLQQKYITERKSARQIADELVCSETKVNYWLFRYGIAKRTIAEAVYIRSNPSGDPFTFQHPRSSSEWFLYGLGLGLFWGEGNKVNKHSVRLGNTDADLIKVFLRFLIEIFSIDKKRLRFGLQLFTDISKEKALRYWCEQLHIQRSQFQTIVVTLSRKEGTYRKKSPYGVLTVYFSNTKLRDSIVTAIEELRAIKPM